MHRQAAHRLLPERAGAGLAGRVLSDDVTTPGSSAGRGAS
jgi:hypothetical protein